MWCLETLDLLNHLANQQARRGLPEKDALFLMTDPRRKDELAERSEVFLARKDEAKKIRQQER